jgi:hypothetical protein
MTYPEAIEFLYRLRLFGLKLGLENTLRLAEFAGNPQRELQFIHVAGTNGKGSTCAMLESIYSAAGLRVGLFTSPHLVSFSERIQVDRTPIAGRSHLHPARYAQWGLIDQRGPCAYVSCDRTGHQGRKGDLPPWGVRMSLTCESTGNSPVDRIT